LIYGLALLLLLLLLYGGEKHNKLVLLDKTGMGTVMVRNLFMRRKKIVTRKNLRSRKLSIEGPFDGHWYCDDDCKLYIHGTSVMGIFKNESKRFQYSIRNRTVLDIYRNYIGKFERSGQRLFWTLDAVYPARILEFKHENVHVPSFFSVGEEYGISKIA